MASIRIGHRTQKGYIKTDKVILRAGEKFEDYLLLAHDALLLLSSVGDALGAEDTLPIFGGNLDVVFD